MITGFEEITKELSEEEETLLDRLAKVLEWSRATEDAPINATEIAVKMQSYTAMKLDGPRLRKMIHEIRVRGMVPKLLANHSGYWIAKDDDEAEKYLISLRQRVASIRSVIVCIERDLKLDEGQLRLI